MVLSGHGPDIGGGRQSVRPISVVLGVTVQLGEWTSEPSARTAGGDLAGGSSCPPSAAVASGVIAVERPRSGSRHADARYRVMVDGTERVRLDAGFGARIRVSPGEHVVWISLGPRSVSSPIRLTVASHGEAVLRCLPRRRWSGWLRRRGRAEVELGFSEPEWTPYGLAARTDTTRRLAALLN